jgi:hypothetical protein
MKITASDFMRHWVTANIHACADPAEAGFDAEPETLAKRCLADAEGLTLAGLEAQFGDLTRYMQSELKRIADLEVTATRI